MGVLQDFDFEELIGLGKMLDTPSERLGGRTTSVFLAQALLRIRRRDGTSAPLVPNRVQLEYERRKGQSNIVLKARQMGISTWVSGQLFLKTITRPGTMTVQVAHTHQAAAGIFRIVQRFVDCLPEGLKKGVLRTSRANVRQLVFPELDSEYRVETAGDRNAGRGITIQNLHCSEVARWPGDPAETLGGLRAAMPHDGELVLESTPNGMAGCFYQEWAKAEWVRSAENGMVRHFFPWWWEPGYRDAAVAEASLSRDEVQLRNEHGLTLEQIGYRRKIAARLGEMGAQEYAEDPDACFLSSGSCVFDSGAIDQRLQSTREPMTRRFDGDLLSWNPPVAGRNYLVAVDPAGGGSEGDFSAVQVIDMATGMQCAELRSKLTTLELAKQADRLARAYNQALLVVERNNHGSGVLAYLHSVCKYDRIYQQQGQDGWLTSTLSRPAMIGELAAALVEQPAIFQSRRLLRECRSFVRLPNGKTGAQAGSHDDCVTAMAIGLSVRAEVCQAGGRQQWPQKCP